LTLKPHSSAWYDRLATLQVGYYYPWRSRVAPLNGEDAYLDLIHQHLTSEMDVLEIACGHGEVPLLIAPLCRSILAYDRVASYIQIAQKAAENQEVDNLTFICADSSADANNGHPHIPADDKSFDLIISRRGPLHWLEDARRVARPGAWLIQLNPLETPVPIWAARLPEPLRSAAGIDYHFGMLDSVKYRLQIGGLAIHSAWTYDVPEVFDDPHELYIRLSWGYLPNEVPSWAEVRSQFEMIFAEYADSEGLVMRHTRLLWTAVVD
jgi:ubiquinone/menaquinone biosynthesis C-methylase UbiE